MGSFYVNIAVKGVSRPQVIEWVKSEGLEAAVGPEVSGWTVFSDARIDQQHLKAVYARLQSLTKEGTCSAIAALVHDEEFLLLMGAMNGTVVAHYNSCPGMMMENPSDEDMRPEVRGLPEMAAVFGRVVTEEQLAQVLRLGTSEYVSVWDVQSDLSKATGWPEYAAGFGYRYATRGEAPEGTTFIK